MTVLKLDHDKPTYPRQWNMRLNWLARRMGWRLIAFALSRSENGGWHGEVLIKGRLHPKDVVAAQAIMGSDWAREGYNLMRTNSPALRGIWRNRFNVLYETHHQKEFAR